MNIVGYDTMLANFLNIYTAFELFGKTLDGLFAYVIETSNV